MNQQSKHIGKIAAAVLGLAGAAALLPKASFPSRAIPENAAASLEKELQVLGALKFVKFHPSWDGVESITYRGQRAEVGGHGMYEFSLWDSGKELKVFCPSSLKVHHPAPGQLRFGDRTSPYTGTICNALAQSGGYNGPAIATGVIRNTPYGVGLMAEEVFIQR